MDFVVFAIIYLVGVFAFLFTMLFGEAAIFVGTPVASLHWLITRGVCDGTWWLVSKSCGGRGRRTLERAEAACCSRPNPLLQLLYLALVLLAYHFYAREVFALLPLPGLPRWHQWSGAAALGACLAAWLAACAADPGSVRPGSLAAHLALYAYDDVTSVQKDCWTCNWQRPARSKHCPVCKRCVARFDHHCGWINNCVGLNNMRWFLLFLASNAALCCYGAVLACLVLREEMTRHGVWQLSYYDYAARKMRTTATSWHLLAQWLLIHYNIPVMLILFMAVGFIMLTSFLAYHLWLTASGMTTYETFKWREYRLQQQQQAQQAAGAPATSSAAQAGWRTHLRRWLWCSRGPGRPARPPQLPAPVNQYNRGLWANFREVLLPDRVLAEAAAKHAKQT